MKTYTIEQIIQALKAKNYAVFENQSKDYNLNIVGIRCANPEANSFDDSICVFWKFKDEWNYYQFRATTDPGKYWLTHPKEANINGTAILIENQWRGCWGIGLHNGKYKALVQIKPVSVRRDADGDGTLDGTGVYTGLFGINIHRSNALHESTVVDKWSAGCQVFANPIDFNQFMSICDGARENFGNSFTYTLIKEEDIPAEDKNIII